MERLSPLVLVAIRSPWNEQPAIMNVVFLHFGCLSATPEIPCATLFRLPYVFRSLCLNSEESKLLCSS